MPRDRKVVGTRKILAYPQMIHSSRPQPAARSLEWTAIGLLAATLLGTLAYLGSRIDATNARIDNLAGRIDQMSHQLTGDIYALAGRSDEHLRRHVG